MNCPLCQSTNIHHECCGSSACTCRSCGYRWDGGVSEPCPVPQPKADAVCSVCHGTSRVGCPLFDNVVTVVCSNCYGTGIEPAVPAEQTADPYHQLTEEQLWGEP